MARRPAARPQQERAVSSRTSSAQLQESCGQGFRDPGHGTRDPGPGTPDGLGAGGCAPVRSGNLLRWRGRKRRGQRCSPFDDVQAQLVAVGQGEELQPRAHAHVPPRLLGHCEYPSDLSRTRVKQTGSGSGLATNTTKKGGELGRCGGISIPKYSV